MDFLNKTAAQIVFHARNGMKQKDFAQIIEKSQAMVSKYEKGTADPPSSVIIHCMNIILERENQRKTQPVVSLEELIERVQTILGPENQAKARKIIMSFLDSIAVSN